MNKFIAAEAAECIGCHACEIACAVAHNQENFRRWNTIVVIDI